jgi:hypothetical protein
MVWAKVGAKIEEALDSITFESLLRQYHGKDRDTAGTKKKTAAAGKGVC